MTEWSQAPDSVLHTAQRMVDKYHPDLKEATIGFLLRDTVQESSGKQIWAHASKVPARLKPFIEFDFIIWVAEEAWNQLTTERREALIDHELCHCVMELGEPKMRHHDVEEFRAIIERHGLWNDELLATRESINRAEAIQLELLGSQVVEAIQRQGSIKTAEPAMAKAMEGD